MTAKTKTKPIPIPSSSNSSNSSNTMTMMMKASDQAELKALPGNDRCIDCGRISPEWASVTLAVFMCLDCSGQHRSLGTHISFVRSVKMDSWTPAQIESMRKGGGNDKCKEFMVSNNSNSVSNHSNSNAQGKIADTDTDTHTHTSVLGYDNRSVSIREKYDSPYGQLWQQVIKARVEGRDEPTELPEPIQKNHDVDGNDDSNSNSNNNKKLYKSIRGGNNNNTNNTVGGASRIKMEGFGSSPHPSELKKARKKRGRRILGAGAAAIGAIAAIGLAARSRRGNKGVSLSMSTRV